MATKKSEELGAKIAARVSEETRARINRLKARGFNISAVIRQILETGLEEFEKGKK